MKTLLSLLCVALVASGTLGWWDETSRYSSGIRESVFRSGSEYIFAYDGQLTSGIPGASQQYSGTRIRAIVTLVFKGENTLLKLSDVRVGRLNTHIPEPRMMLPYRLFEDTPLEPQLKEQLELPVQFSYIDGMVSRVVFERRERSWSANIKRGVLNLLQVNLKEQNRVHSEESRVLNSIPTASPLEARFFKTMEPTLEGECETLYTVTRECGWTGYGAISTSPCLNVTKSINFEKCNKRPEIKYNFRFSDPCPTCESKYAEDQKFLKSATVAKFNISGDRENFLIESARVESQYTFVPFNTEASVIASYVNQTLVLLKSGPIESSFSEPAEPVESDSDMVYTLDWDVQKEKFFMEGDRTFLENTPYSEVPDKVKTVTNILRVLTEQSSRPLDEIAPRQFNRLVTLLRMCKREEIERIHEIFYNRESNEFAPEEQKKIRDLWTDALALAGTKATVSHLINKIRSREIPTLRAALALKNLINTRVVSKEMIQELINLAESEVPERSPFLKQSIWLTIGSMINALCMPNEDVLALETKMSTEQLCPVELRKVYTEKLFRKLESSEKWEDRVLLLKAIGNAGLDASILELEKIIRNVNREYPTYVRKEAILALRQLREIMPKKVQQILMPVYMNRYEQPEIRIVASYIILKTLPERPILDQIAKSVYAEPSKQVASFVFSYLSALANSTNPCLKKISHDARLSLRFAKAVNPGALYSKFADLQFHSEHYKVGMDVNAEWVFSNRSYIPRHISTTLNANFLGFWHKYLLTIGMDTENVESLVYKYLGERGILYEQPWEEILRKFVRNTETETDSDSKEQDEEERYRWHPRDTDRETFKYEKELKDIFNTLKISPREFSKEPIAYFYMKFKDQEFGFLPLLKWRDMMKESFSLNEILEKLRNGVSLDVHQGTILHETMYKIPTTLGMPLAVSVSVPTVMSLKGKLHVTMDRTGVASVEAKLQPSFVSTIITKVEAWSPIVNHGVKVMAQAKVFVPVNARLHVDLRSESKSVKLTIEPPQTKHDLVVLETRPVTYTIVWPKFIENWEEPEEKTVMAEEVNRMYAFDKTYGRRTLGLEFRVRGHMNRTPFRTVPGTPFCPLSGPNKIVLTVEPGEDKPSEIEVKLTTDLYRRFQESLRSEFRDFKPFDSSDDEEYSSSDYKQFEATQGNENTLRLEVIAKSSVPRTLVAEIRHKFDEEMRYNKLVAKIERSPLPELSERWEACFEGEMLHPKISDKISEMVGQKVISNARFTWGQSCNSENFITVKAEGARSQEQMKLERQTPFYQMYENCQDKTLCSPVSVSHYMNVLGQLKKYKIDIEYQNVPASLKNLTNKIFRMAKYYYFWQTDVAEVQIQNPSNRIRAEITIDPLTNQRVNVTVKAPQQNVRMVDLPLPVPVAPLNTRRSYFREFLDYVTEDKFEPLCHIGSRHIQTFDGERYSVPMTNCYSVVAKDCSAEPKFVVMMKKMSADSETKKVLILTRNNKIVLTPTSGNYDQIKVEVNGEEYNPRDEPTVITHHSHVVAKPLVGGSRIIKRESHIEVILPETGVKVFFDGYAADVKLSHMFRGEQCGLCGHFDLEESDEFRNPQFRRLDDVREFFSSYLLKDDECASFPETRSLCQDSRCEYKPYWETTKKIETEDEVLRSAEPVRRTKVIEHRNKLCFSEEPLPKCATHTNPENTVEREVRFRCIRRDSATAEALHREVRQRVIRMEELTEELLDSFTHTETVPTTCKPYYFNSEWN